MQKEFDDFDWQDLKKFRQTLGVDYRKFANILNCSKSYLHDIETKKKPLDAWLIKQLKIVFPSVRDRS